VSGKSHQAEVKLKNRASWQDLGLVFSKEQADLFGKHAQLGTPMQFHNIGVGEFARIRKAAKVMPGHRKIAITLDT
jgi:hypothetical protein